MASAEVKLEVTCSICKEIYTNPVTLICGHSFCQVCITRTFDNQEDREYFCPECMKRFIRRPELKKNPRLSNIADHFHSVESKGDNPKNVCSYCVHSPVSAVTLCLHCEAFLCDVHKQTHNKSHVLTDPTTSLEGRKCSVHQKILEYYCTLENTFICAHCMTSDHNGHRVSTVSEFLQQQKKNLKPILEKLSTRKEETEAKIQSLQDHEKNIDKGADGVAERVTTIMTDIRRQHHDLEKRVLSDITKQKQQISLFITNRIQQLEKEKTELQKKITQIEELSRNTNPLPTLMTPELLFCVLQDNLDRGISINTIHDIGDLEEVVILETLYSGLSNIMVIARKDVHVTDAHTHSLSAAFTNVNLRNRNVFNRSQIISNNRTTAQEMLLDVETASNFLLISDNLKTVSRSDVYLDRPETLERFLSPQVISIRGIFSGKLELEMEVKEIEGHDGDPLFIGMCYPTIDRRGSMSEYENTDNAWGLWVHRLYPLVHDSTKINFCRTCLGAIKLVLDYEAGRLSFYELGNSIKHLRTFTATFTEPLHLLVSVQGNARVKILKCLSY